MTTLPVPGLPSGWHAREPDERDIAALATLRAAAARAATGSGSPDVAAVQSEVLEAGSWTRRQVITLDERQQLRAWAGVQDRAAGRIVLHVTLDHDLDTDTADPLAAGLFTWCEGAAEAFTRLRGRQDTQLDAGAYDADHRHQRQLERAGFSRTRRWLQMSRPVDPSESDAGAHGPGVVVRRVRRRPNGYPVAVDVQSVHQVLEESFADHFNTYRESFPEFVQRLQEDPGHAWDHWWLAVLIDDDGEEYPGGAVVCSMLRPDDAGAYGSYIDYIGVHRRARGRGVAKALLHTVVADAASRGRSRVGLEVDDESPTGADGLYRSLGFETKYVTQSWHRDVTFSPADSTDEEHDA